MHYVLRGLDIAFHRASQLESPRIDLTVAPRSPVGDTRRDESENISKVLDAIDSFGERGATYGEVKVISENMDDVYACPHLNI